MQDGGDLMQDLFKCRWMTFDKKSKLAPTTTTTDKIASYVSCHLIALFSLHISLDLFADLIYSQQICLKASERDKVKIRRHPNLI